MSKLKITDDLNKPAGSIVEETFKELDEKLSVINKETRDWIKLKIMWHITEAYDRGKHAKEKS